MAPKIISVVAAFLVAAASTGCTQTPFRSMTAGTPVSFAPQASSPPLVPAAVTPLPSFANADPKQLEMQLTRSRQETQVAQEELSALREQLAATRRDYVNAVEYFAWAPDDMVEMSPDEEFWSSGQTNYRMHRETICRQIRLAHEQGVAVATYGKFVMSGLAGWQTAYDRPLDHRFQYNYPVGMWEGVDVTAFDRRRDGDFAVYGRMPTVPGSQPFNNWWASFLPINPDPTPRMARIAAEECVRSIEMFGWDAIRWDGHIRAGGQCGRGLRHWHERGARGRWGHHRVAAARWPGLGMLAAVAGHG